MVIQTRKPTNWLLKAKRTALHAALALSLAAGFSNKALAEDLTTQRLPIDEPAQITVPAQDWQAMQQRLEAAERRLQHIETQRLPPIDELPAQPASAPPAAQDELQKRVEALEKDLKKQAEAAAKKKADAAKKPTGTWTGRIHADYWGFPVTSPGANAFETGDATDRPEDRFLFRRVRFGLAGDIADNMTYKAEFDINQPQSPQFKDCYFGWEELPILQTVLIGNQKRPYGLDPIESSRYTVFIERPFIVDAINQDARRFGVLSYGVSDDEAFNWRYGGFLMQDMQQTGTVFTDPQTDDFQAEFAGRLANTIWYDEASDGRGFAHWAIAGTLANPTARDVSNSAARFQTRPEARTSERWIDTGVIVGTEQYEMLAFEGLLNIGAVQIVGEYQHVWLQRDGDTNLQFDGSYVYISYFLTGESMVWDRQTGQLGRVTPLQNFWIVDTCDDGVEAGWGAWQLALRYSECDFNDDNIAGGIGESITFGMNWHWNAYARMQFNLVHGDIHGRAPVDGQTDARYTILGTRFMVEY